MQNCTLCLTSPYKLPFRDYFRGLLANSKMVTINNVCFLELYEQLLSQLRGLGMAPTASYLVASVASRGFMSLVTLPLENRRLLQSLNSPQARMTYKGTRVTVGRDMAFSAVYWPLVESIRGAMIQQDYREVAKDRHMLLWANLLSASLASALSAMLTSPLDLAKTRLQAGITSSSLF
jgi:hypothetical protein